MRPISLRIFLFKHLQSQGHLLCWYLLFSREQTRHLQEDGGIEIFLVPVSATQDVFFIDLTDGSVGPGSSYWVFIVWLRSSLCLCLIVLSGCGCEYVFVWVGEEREREREGERERERERVCVCVCV